MSFAFGDIRTLQVSDKARAIMRDFIERAVVDEQRTIWMLGASLGITHDRECDDECQGRRSTFQNINSLDPDGVFAAYLLGKYPGYSPERRVKKLVNHAEWGIRYIAELDEANALNISKLGLPV